MGSCNGTERSRADTSPSSRRLCQQLRQANAVERGACEDEEPIDVGQTTQFDFADPRDGFQPAERRFDPRPRMLTHRIAHVSCRPAVDRATARTREILRYVRGGPQLAREVDEFAHVIRLVGANGAAAARGPLPLRVPHLPQGSIRGPATSGDDLFAYRLLAKSGAIQCRELKVRQKFAAEFDDVLVRPHQPARHLARRLWD